MKAPALLLILSVATATAAPLLQDDFGNVNLPARRALRGDWKLGGNAATCTQDDALYKKHKDHGPILFYDLGYTDASLRFAFQPDAGTKTVVFTANGEDGHIFRIVFSPSGTSVRAFPPDAGDQKSIALGTEKDLKLEPGAWTAVRVDLRGPRAILTVGGFSRTYEHASLARAKTNLSIGFSFGAVSVRDVVVEP